MSKTTPGPWEYHPPDIDAPGYVASQTTGDVICDLMNWNTEEANGLLIAAAPELLESLKILVHKPLYKISNEDWKNADAAIRKAEGEE